MKHDVKIVGVNLRDRVQKSGNRELAFFDVELRGLAVKGCLLIAFKNGRIDFSGPRLMSAPDTHGIDIRDATLRTEVVEAALGAYQLLGGVYEAPATKPEDDAEMKLLRDIGLAGPDNKPVTKRQAPQLPAEIIAELERRGLTTK
jgi:hypothetical protein